MVPVGTPCDPDTPLVPSSPVALGGLSLSHSPHPCLTVPIPVSQYLSLSQSPSCLTVPIPISHSPSLSHSAHSCHSPHPCLTVPIPVSQSPSLSHSPAVGWPVLLALPRHLCPHTLVALTPNDPILIFMAFQNRPQTLLSFHRAHGEFQKAEPG